LYRTHAAAQKALRLSVSTSLFVPKPFTPFQWARQDTEAEYAAKTAYLRDKLRRLGVQYGYHEYKVSRLECVFSRGDARLGAVLENAVAGGCYLDGWTEWFNYDAWLRAFADAGVDIDGYTVAKDPAAALPWDGIDVGVTKDYLLSEAKKADEGGTTDDCRNGCHACGMQDVCGGGTV
ncbi:MAG: B12-binding domain-containing radical SAM protein, partial [Clostridiales bacterium]|nr:B12-binding domain-containing radical SAM protein [Clostridiales bacterium]